MTTNYMPDNMGFPTLPEKMLVAPYTRCGAKELMGYYEHTCHHCGKVFEATHQHRYRLTIADKDCWFCRYNCFAPYEKKAAEQYRNIRLGFTKKMSTDGEKSVQQRAREHLAYCKRKLAKYQAKRDNPEIWKTLTENQKKSNNNQVRVWKEKLMCAEVTLKVVTDNENT